MDWAEIGSHLFATVVGAGIIGFCGFFLWLWKRSVYGRLDSLQKSVDDFGTSFKRELDDAKILARENVMEAKVLAERGLSEIKKDVSEAKLIATKGIAEVKDALAHDYVTSKLCDSERVGCKALWVMRLDALQENLGNKMDDMIRSQDKLAKSHDDLTKRVNAHMNGHGLTRED